MVRTDSPPNGAVDHHHQKKRTFRADVHVPTHSRRASLPHCLPSLQPSRPLFTQEKCLETRQREGAGSISHIITGNSVVCLLRPLCFAKRIGKNRNENTQVRHTGTQRKWSTGEGDEQGNAVERQNKRNNNKKKHIENNESFFFSPLFRF